MRAAKVEKRRVTGLFRSLSMRCNTSRLISNSHTRAQAERETAARLRAFGEVLWQKSSPPASPI